MVWPAIEGLGEARMVNRRWRLALAGSEELAASDPFARDCSSHDKETMRPD